MTITYHSQNRKELVKAISEIIGIPAVYQFMPTCAYKIGECYTVTKSGNLEISDQADREETERLLAELANRGYVVPDTSEPESKGLTVQMPADFFTEHTLGNLRQICENKAALFQTAFQEDRLFLQVRLQYHEVLKGCPPYFLAFSQRQFFCICSEKYPQLLQKSLCGFPSYC